MSTLRSLVSTLSIAICLAASWPCTAKESVSQDDLSAQKELLQAKLDANKELTQKDIEILYKRFDAVDKRIDDQVSRVSDIGNSVDRFTTIIGVIGTLITVLLTLGGLIGYFSVVAKVRETAQETAKKWLQENEKELRSRTDTLHSNAQEAINTTLEGVTNSASEAKAAMERAQKEIGRTQPDAPATPVSRKDTETLQRRSEELKSIPENSYSFDDWNTRAFAAYNDGRLERAALYWENAAKIPAAGAENSASALFNQGVSLGQLHKHDAAIAAFDQLISRYTNDTSNALREQVAKAIVNSGATHGQMGDNDKAIAAYEQVIATYSSDPALREPVATAMVNKGIRLGKMGDNEKEIAAYEQVIAAYSSDPTPALREQVARAMVNKGFTHGQMGDNEKEIAAYEQVIATYSSDPAPALREQVAKTMVNKGATHGQMGDNEKEIAAYEQVIATYSSDPALREPVARAMVNKGATHGQMGANDKAIATYEQVIDTYSSDPAPALREQVAKAMVNKGITHGKMGNNDKEIATYEQVIDTYSSDPAPALHEQVTRALNCKGFTLLLSAKEQLVSGDGHQANNLLQKGETDLQAAVERKPQWGIALGNLAYIQWLLKRPAESEATFRDALTAKDDGGEHLYKDTLDDITQHPIPEDAAFREMVTRVWTEFQALKSSES